MGAKEQAAAILADWQSEVRVTKADKVGALRDLMDSVAREERARLRQPLMAALTGTRPIGDWPGRRDIVAAVDKVLGGKE